MTIGFAAKQKQLQNFLLSLPSLAFHLKSHKKLEVGKWYFKRTIDSDTGEKISESTDKNKKEWSINSSALQKPSCQQGKRWLPSVILQSRTRHLDRPKSLNWQVIIDQLFKLIITYLHYSL